jgi:hypothetical protein
MEPNIFLSGQSKQQKVSSIFPPAFSSNEGYGNAMGSHSKDAREDQEIRGTSSMNSGI